MKRLTVRFLAVIILALATLGLAACGADTPEASDSSDQESSDHFVGRVSIYTVRHEGISYRPVAGPIREELLDLDRLTPTGLVLGDSDQELVKGSEGRKVFTLSGVPIEQGFLVRSNDRGYGPDVKWGTKATSYPVCQSGSGAYVYTAKGASPSPRWIPSRGPAYPGGPTPTPVPTPPNVPIVATALSAQGLLGVGWPVVNMERLQFGFRGVEYLFTAFRSINEHGADSSISSAEIEELETLSITYFIDLAPLPAPALEEITSDGTVTDHVRVYRLEDRPAGEVIVVDQCPADLQGDQFSYFQPTQAATHSNNGDSPPVPTSTPEPLLPGGTSRAPDHVRLDLDDGVVVAFAADPSLGRIAYVTHVPSGAQVVLDREGKVIERHDPPGVDSDLLDATLEDSDAMTKIRRGLQYEGVLVRDPIRSWINAIHFEGASYYPASEGADGVATGEVELDRSELGPVIYWVAFCLSCNIDLPMGYQVQDGDATLLDPGTAVYSVNGYDPSERVAVIVDGEVLLYDKFEPTPPIITPTPSFKPTDPEASRRPSSDKYSEEEQQLRAVMGNFPSDEIVWIDGDTVVYTLARDPHAYYHNPPDFSKGFIAVAQHLPTGATKAYALSSEAASDTGVRRVEAIDEYAGDHPEGKEVLDRMQRDPKVIGAVTKLLRRVE